MPASTGPTQFAVLDAGGPGSERLPRLFRDDLGECTIMVDVTAPEVRASWYDIWQAAVTLDGKCARSGKSGLARFVGEWRRFSAL